MIRDAQHAANSSHIRGILRDLSRYMGTCWGRDPGVPVLKSVKITRLNGRAATRGWILQWTTRKKSFWMGARTRSPQARRARTHARTHARTLIFPWISAMRYQRSPCASIPGPSNIIPLLCAQGAPWRTPTFARIISNSFASRQHHPVSEVGGWRGSLRCYISWNLHTDSTLIIRLEIMSALMLFVLSVSNAHKARNSSCIHRSMESFAHQNN